MSTKRFSPSANLLRKSRLFSLPSTLQRPGERGGRLLEGTEGTSPHPLQQAITTPQSSLARGDWGLKRSLPARSTAKTSTPLIRINALDTIEHVTDFNSAADLSLTLAKVQELALPITTRPTRNRASVMAESKSVFEAASDHTDPRAAAKNPANQRWRFQGPWLGGMSESEFIRYVAKELRGRKAEFAAFLKEHHAQVLEKSRRQENRERGVDMETSVDQVTAEQSFQDWMKHLRANFALVSELSRLISIFLDLPGATSVSSLGSFDDVAIEAAERGPPRTHPSAGLSYLKSNAIVPNHPLLGPQANAKPIEARVLRARSNQVRDPAGRLGVAGVVAADGLLNRLRVPDSFDEGAHDTLIAREKQGSSVGVATPGGNRIWVQPSRATVDEEGRVQISVNSGDRTAVGVHTGDLMTPQVSSQYGKNSYSQKLNILDQPKRRPEIRNTGDMVAQLGNILANERPGARK